MQLRGPRTRFGGLIFRALALLVALFGAEAVADETGRVASLVAEVLRLAEPRDEARLRDIAKRADLDTWVVAEVLRARGAGDAARSLARAWDDPESDVLLAHLNTTPPPALPLDSLNRLLEAEALLEGKDPSAAKGKLEGQELPSTTILGIWLMRLRARAAERSGRPEEARRERLAACAAAMQIGYASYPAVAVRRVVEAMGEADEYVIPRRALLQREAAFRKRNDRYRAGRQLALLGGLAAHSRDYASSAAFYRQAVDDFRAVGRLDYLAFCLSEEALAERVLGDYAKSLSLLAESLATLAKQKPGDLAARAEVLDRLGNLRHEFGEPEEALRLHREAYALHRSAQSTIGMASARANEGADLRALDAHDAAEAALADALRLFEGLKEARGIAAAWDEQARLAVARGRHADALALLERALPLLEQRGDSFRVAAAHGLVADVHAVQGKPELERASRHRALAEAESIGAADLITLERGHLAWLEQREGSRLQAQGRAQDARRAFMEAKRLARDSILAGEEVLRGLGGDSGASARALRSTAWQAGALAAIATDDTEGAFYFVESGRAAALLAAIGQAVVEPDWDRLPPGLRETLAEARAAEATLAWEYRQAREGTDMEARAQARQKWAESRNVVRRAIETVQVHEALRSPGARAPVPTLEDTRRALGTDVLLIYVRLGSRLFALIVDAAGLRRVDLGEVEPVAEAVAALRAAAQGRAAPGPGGSGQRAFPEEAPVVRAAKRLDALIAVPLKLPSGGRLLVSPDGALAVAPLALLPTLSDRVVALIPSATTWLRLAGVHGRPSGIGTLAIGDPVYGDARVDGLHAGWNVPRLPGAGREIALVASGPDDKPYVRAEAAEPSLLSAHDAYPGRTWKSIHFASHAVIHPTVAHLSALVLMPSPHDDGYLTALEASLLPLRADVVVLSACDTAQGKTVQGEGLVGLVRAFLVQVAPCVVATLWQVDDQAAFEFMKAFYPALRSGLAPDAAVAAAQQALRRSERWSDPRHWACWVAWGAPSR